MTDSIFQDGKHLANIEQELYGFAFYWDAVKFANEHEGVLVDVRSAVTVYRYLMNTVPEAVPYRFLVLIPEGASCQNQ